MTVLFGHNLNELLEQVNEDNANQIIERILNKMSFAKSYFDKFKDVCSFFKQKLQHYYKIFKDRQSTEANIDNKYLSNEEFYEKYLDHSHMVAKDLNNDSVPLSNDWFKTFDDLMDARMPYCQRTLKGQTLMIRYKRMNINNRNFQDNIFNRIYIIDYLYRQMARRYTEMTNYYDKRGNKKCNINFYKQNQRLKLDEDTIDQYVNKFCNRQNINLNHIRKSDLFKVQDEI